MANGLLVANGYFGIGLEATRGTGASVTTFTPVVDPQLAPDLKWLKDSALRGSPVMDYDLVPGSRSDKFTGKVFTYVDVYPQLFRAILGSSDTVASPGGGVFTHTIGLLNSASIGSQPPSYTVINNSIDNCYQVTGAQGDSLSISFGAEAAVETTFAFIGNPAASVAAPVVNESTQHLIPGWNTSASIGGAAVSVIESGQIDIKRSTAPIFTANGSQGPLAVFAGPIEVTGKFTFVVNTGETFFNAALLRDPLVTVLTFVDPVTAGSVQLQMSSLQLQEPQIKQSGKNWLTLESNFEAYGNTTDDVNGGYSPIKTVTSNAQAAAY